jgi:hypothetical protein
LKPKATVFQGPLAIAHLTTPFHFFFLSVRSQSKKDFSSIED